MMSSSEPIHGQHFHDDTSFAGSHRHVHMANIHDPADNNNGPQTPEEAQATIRTAMLQAVTAIRRDVPRDAPVAPGPNEDLDFLTPQEKHKALHQILRDELRPKNLLLYHALSDELDQVSQEIKIG